MSENKAITKRADNYSQWYLDIVEQADMAENSVVRGCMVIKPYGYSIWEMYQQTLDKMFKDLGHVNAYFPIFIPKSFLSKEAEHVDGFAQESAVVTHHRLKTDPTTRKVTVDPESKLDEELIVRPTSETIIYDSFSRWITSYRDLPVLINQWANVVRWEMRTRPFIRTAEFLWQEGHTAHATHDEAEQEARQMLGVYQKFAEEHLAIPVIPGQKSESEKFAGALRTYTIEAMMQDGKALQAGTSHNLGDNFAKAFDVKFTDKDGQIKHVWQTSWGFSTRMIGGMIMTHSDDKGLVVPPKIAPIQVVFIPIWREESQINEVLGYINDLANELSNKDISFKVDNRDFLTFGEKHFEWEKKGVPIRIEVGPRDIQNNKVVLVRRDQEGKEILERSSFAKLIEEKLDLIQKNLYKKAMEYREQNTHRTDDYLEFKKIIEQDKPGFIYSHWCESKECELKVKEDTKATTRCIPFNTQGSRGKCLVCSKNTGTTVIFAKAY
jgi:prolyl-tRNA synthetase